MHSLSLPKAKTQTRKRENSTYHSQILKRPRLLNILQRLLQIHQLPIHQSLGLLRILHRLRLKSLNRLDLPPHIIRHGLERLDVLFNLVDHGLVLERGAVTGEIERLGSFGEELDFAAGVVVAFFEGGEGGGCLAFEAEGGADFGPVDFKGGTSLWEVGEKMSVLVRTHRSIPVKGKDQLMMTYSDSHFIDGVQQRRSSFV